MSEKKFSKQHEWISVEGDTATVGIKPEGKIIEREGVKVFSYDGNEIGSITSGTFGPSVNGPIAMGYVKLNFTRPGTKVFLEVRGKKHEAKISELPFYKKSYVR